MPGRLRIGVIVLALLAMAYGIGRQMQSWFSTVEETDFPGYFTAAYLVSHGPSPQIYDYGESVSDPTTDDPGPGSPYHLAAKAVGLASTSLYDYPPTLADLLAPLVFLPPGAAMMVWQTLNLAALVGTCSLLTGLIGPEYRNRIWLVTALVVCFRPTLDCLNWVNVTIFLLALMIAGFALYRRGKNYAAGAAFALAAGIKLTPVIVAIPLLAWRDWKILKTLGLWSGIIFGLLLLINGPAALELYLFQVLPSMSHKTAELHDLGLAAAVQSFGHLIVPGAPPSSLAWVAKLLSVTVLCYAAWLSRTRSGEVPDDRQKFETFAMFLLLSCCLSPIAWLYAFVLAAPALLIAGKRVWRGDAGQFETLWFFGLTVMVSVGRQMQRVAERSHFPTLKYCVALTPLLGILLGIVSLYRLANERGIQGSVASNALLSEENAV
jgi:alpha-1,2-mannosyltransferase